MVRCVCRIARRPARERVIVDGRSTGLVCSRTWALPFGWQPENRKVVVGYTWAGLHCLVLAAVMVRLKDTRLGSVCLP
jgi:hypothetical protein